MSEDKKTLVLTRDGERHVVSCSSCGSTNVQIAETGHQGGMYYPPDGSDPVMVEAIRIVCTEDNCTWEAHVKLYADKGDKLEYK